MVRFNAGPALIRIANEGTGPLELHGSAGLDVCNHLPVPVGFLDSASAGINIFFSVYSRRKTAGMPDEAEDRSKADLTVEYSRRLAVYTLWLTVATAMTAALSVISLIIAVWIASSTEDLKRSAASQLKEMESSAKQVERSIKAANDQVVESRTANEISKSLQTNQLRAYLVIDRHQTLQSVSINGVTSPTRGMQMEYDIKNVGQTPAYKVSSYKEERIVDLVGDFSVRESEAFQTGPDKNETPEAVMIGAGNVQTTIRSHDAMYSTADINDFRAGRKIYAYWGVVYYEDIFHIHRYFRFCRYFKFGNLDTWYSCLNHNDAS